MARQPTASAEAAHSSRRRSGPRAPGWKVVHHHPPEAPLCTRCVQHQCSPAFAAVGAGRCLAGGPIATPSPFNGAVGPRRALAVADLSLRDARRIEQQLGGSVDDVVMAAVALGLGRYLRRAGIATEGRRLRAMVPVAMPRPNRDLGTHATAMFLDLPVGAAPVACLHDVVAVKALRRTWHEPLGMHVALEATGSAPPALAAPVTRVLSALPWANVILSDVPPHEEPMTLLGAPLLVSYPLMPLPAAVGLAIAVLTFGDAMGLGVTTDPDLVPGGGDLAADIGAGFASLLDAARAAAG
jgi:diacylglycerol O-acyltransferase / wax synthase